MTIDISVVPVRPWLTIWTKPRETIRKIIDYDLDYYVIPLAVTSGILQSLNNSLSNERIDVIVGLLLSFIAGPIGGLIGLYIGGAIYSWTGGWFGGQASSDKVRPAIAWSSIPIIFLLLLFFPFNLLIRSGFLSDLPGPIGAAFGLLVIVIFFGSALIFGLWRLYLLIQCLAEVHEFSSWRALATIISGFLLIFIPLLLLIFSCGQL
jgi:hypothetical protein